MEPLDLTHWQWAGILALAIACEVAMVTLRWWL